MSGRISTRPRRTKVYDCNYRASERYYRPVLDDVDRKYAGRTEAGGGLSTLRGALADAEASLGARPRASPDGDLRERRPLSALLDDAEAEDTSPFRRGGARRRLVQALEDAEEDDDFLSSRRVRESRARIAALEDEIAAAKTSSRSKMRSATDEFAEKVLDTVGLKNSDISRARQFLEDESFIKRRSRAVAAAADEEDTSSRGVARWSKLADMESALDTRESAAASRARQSRARIADIESEMEELENRGAARERRSAKVRALLQETADIGAESAEAASTTVRASALRVKKVSATAEKKTVTF